MQPAWFEAAHNPATAARRVARQLAALWLLAACGATPAVAQGVPAAQAALVAWPPGWTVETGPDRIRARPGAGDQAFVDLLREPGPPRDALAAASARVTTVNGNAGLDVGCGDAAPVRLGQGTGLGIGCAASRSGLPLLKFSLVAWPVPGGSAVLVFTATPGPFETYLGAFKTVVASAHAD